ncbi:uncharacterized protein JN550_005752 [Neoarthrinium moseri]|uniref:uncharacterized protein n=1 Tax=Neoarthrinium moseri TaxID=1658444 RepID=UPI001FDBCB82|nr:uncharacterized protein JN550_005752 [Neoarthrinium moseri]KAI1869771.1 hypothetical protein JN550_005752 [Neoarthrinium moseri]
MYHPNKRRKTNYYSSQNEEVSLVELGQYNHGNQKESSQFNGQGLNNHHSNLDIGRDLIINNHQPNHTDNDKLHKARESVFTSLCFDQMDARQLDVRIAHNDTCQWFLQTPQYINWLNMETPGDQDRFLWIKGNPGAGKSTLMRFVLDETRRSMESRKVLVASFFFNARGFELERSTSGLYRSLLVQILEARSDLWQILDFIRPGHQWKIASLQSLLALAIKRLEHPFICFIDALDECEQTHIRDLVSFLHQVSNDRTSQVYTCFASRYYPNITVSKGVDFHLDRQYEHGQDIDRYLNDVLCIGNDFTLAEQIRREIQHKASGIFLWVVLVVRVLNAEYDAGRKHLLHQRLREAPENIHEVFYDMLSRKKDDLEGLQVCLGLVLFARRPLSLMELYFAIISKLEPQQLAFCHSTRISVDDAQRYILDKSGGFVETTRAPNRTVQFIHQSFRDFLTKESTLSSIWPHGAGNFEGQSHDTLKRSCQTYIDMMGPSLKRLSPDETLGSSSREARQFLENVDIMFPFIKYANNNLFYHADRAECLGISQRAFLSQISTEEWARQYARLSGQALSYPTKVSLLYILASRKLASLIRVHTCGQSCFEIEDAFYGAPIFAELVGDDRLLSYEKLVALLDMENNQMDATLHLDFQKRLQDRKNWWKTIPTWEFPLLRATRPLSLLAKYGLYWIIPYYFAIQKNVGELIDHKTDDGLTPLFLAVKGGHLSTSQLLLEKGANINLANKDGCTPLHVAAEHGHSQLVRLLIECGGNLHVTRKDGTTPLLSASKNRHPQVAKMLAERGADPNSRSGCEGGGTALQLEVRNGCLETVTLLIHYGANVNTADSLGVTPLHMASRHPSTTIARLVIEHGAYVSSKTNKGRTALHYAIEGRNPGVTKLLLENKANVNETDNDGLAPLHLASEQGNAVIAQLLIDHGAKLNDSCQNGRTPISLASERANFLLAKLLVENGANLYAARKYSWDLLNWAYVHGHFEMAKMLVKHGADLNATDDHGNTLIYSMASCGHAGVVRLLIEHGADVNILGKDGRRPLYRATANGHSELPMLLKQHGAQRW